MVIRQAHTVLRVMVQVIPAALLLLLIVWGGTRYVALQTMEQEIRATLAAQTRLISAGIGDRIASLEAYADILSGNDLIISSLIDFSAREKFLNTFFRSLKAPGVTHARILLLDYQGRPIVSNTPEPVSADGENSLDIVMSGARTLDIRPDILSIWAPVKHGGVPRGILVLELDTQDMAELFEPETRMIATAVILTPHGKIFSSDARFSHGQADLSRDPGQPETGWITRTAPVPGYDMLEVACGVLRADALGQYRQVDRYLMAATLVILTLLILGIFLSAHLTVRPVKQFTDLIRTARASRKPVPDFPEKGSPEIASLAEALNALIREGEQARTEQVNQAIEAGRSQLSAMVLQNLTDYVAGDARAREAVSRISDILSLHQNYGDGIREFREQVDLNAMVKIAVQIHQPAHENRGILLLLDLAPILPPLLLDKSRTLQILASLLKNSYESIDAIRDSSPADTESQRRHTITIRTVCTQTEIECRISDSGIGMDPDVRAGIFEPGHSRKGSSGMGLYDCKSFLEANNATLVLDSKGFGSGTTARIIFRLSDPA